MMEINILLGLTGITVLGLILLYFEIDELRRRQNIYRLHTDILLKQVLKNQDKILNKIRSSDEE